MSIHPYLVARFCAVQALYDQLGLQSIAPAPRLKMPDLSHLLKDTDDDGEGGGGGGTAKGLRAKNAFSANAVEAAKQSMRRLGRR